METIDLGWLVGILEGEGTFIVYQDKRRLNTFSVKIQVESTDQDVIEKLNNIFPGRVWESNYPSKFKAFPNAKDSWRWAISTKSDVKILCDLVYPYMGLRRKQQIDKVLLNCKYKYKENL